MFTVLNLPFPSELGAHSCAHAILVYEGKRKTRILIQSIARSEERRIKNIASFESRCKTLNDPTTSLAQVKSILRSIQNECMTADAARNRHFQSSTESFRADFGRQDFGRPGQGGSGVDGYW